MGARREVVSAVAERYRLAKQHVVRALRQRETVMPGEVGASRESAPPWLHSAVPPDRVRPLQERSRLGARDQARRLPPDRPTERRSREALLAPGL
jgi:hypothetical protein